MKKLAVIAIAGVLTLSACTENQGQTAGELLMFSVVAGGIVCGAAQIC
jgi:protein involved in sex pheromone biosynthesis